MNTSHDRETSPPQFSTAPPGTEPATPSSPSHAWTVTDAEGATVAWCVSFGDAVRNAAPVPHSRIKGPWDELLSVRPDALGIDELAHRIATILRAPLCALCQRPVVGRAGIVFNDKGPAPVCPDGCAPRH